MTARNDVASLACAVLFIATVASGQTRPAVPKLLNRQYHQGEKIAYTMNGTNQANTYEIQAVGEVKKDAAGLWYEEFAWTNAIYNGKPMELPPAAAAFRQRLSLAPAYRLAVPDLSKVPNLIGPIADLLTFYADWQVASSLPNLTKAGDHGVMPSPIAPSWADGTRIVLGEDSFDFDVTIDQIDAQAHTATIVVRHVPPAKPLINIPVEWMRAPVADTPNNWVEVEKNPDGTYVGRIGKETFDVTMKVDLKTGRIVSGTLDNLVEVLERKCDDSTLAKAGEPSRFQIKRKIEIR
jgi:hypothetical protein